MFFSYIFPLQNTFFINKTGFLWFFAVRVDREKDFLDQLRCRNGNLNIALTSKEYEDKDGTIVAAYTPSKQYSSVAVSSPKLVVSSSYTLNSGTTKIVEFTLTNELTYLSESGITTKSQNAGPGGSGGGGKRPGEQRPQ